jgi:hypothetical protein
MWMEKLSDGVLRVLTPFGPRYIKPSFLQRFYLAWIFRYFDRLPPPVLSRRQQMLIETLCTSQSFVSPLQNNGWEEAPIIGTVELRPPVLVQEELLRRKKLGVAEPGATPSADQECS